MPTVLALRSMQDVVRPNSAPDDVRLTFDLLRAV